MIVTSIKDLAECIQKKVKDKPCFVIAISGFGGAGKSTIAKQLAETLGNTVIVAADDFIIDQLSLRSASWEPFDWARHEKQVLAPMRLGKHEITYDVYDWVTNSLGGKRTVGLGRFLIIEGVGVIRDQLKPYLDIKVSVDVPLEVASKQGEKRDREQYGADHDKTWDEIWTPNDKEYFNTLRPDLKADYILKLN